MENRNLQVGYQMSTIYNVSLDRVWTDEESGNKHEVEIYFLKIFLNTWEINSVRDNFFKINQFHNVPIKPKKQSLKSLLQYSCLIFEINEYLYQVCSWKTFAQIRLESSFSDWSVPSPGEMTDWVSQVSNATFNTWSRSHWNTLR